MDFTLLKKYYANECEKWLRNHPGRTITVFQIFTPAYLKAATLSCAGQSFKVTGIEPYDPVVFTEADFLASSVTDREQVTSEAVISESEPQPSTSGVVKVNSPQTDKTTDATKKSTTLTAVENICPIPKAADRKTSDNRKRKKSDIISSSPYKIEVENQMALQKKPKLKLDAKNTQSKFPKLPQKRRYVGAVDVKKYTRSLSRKIGSSAQCAGNGGMKLYWLLRPRTVYVRFVH